MGSAFGGGDTAVVLGSPSTSASAATCAAALGKRSSGRCAIARVNQPSNPGGSATFRRRLALAEGGSGAPAMTLMSSLYAPPTASSSQYISPTNIVYATCPSANRSAPGPSGAAASTCSGAM